MTDIHRALHAQADRLCRMGAERIEVLPALAQELTPLSRGARGMAGMTSGEMTKLGWCQCRGGAAGFFRVPFSTAFFIDAAWRGLAPSMRSSAMVGASSECLRGCVAISHRPL